MVRESIFEVKMCIRDSKMQLGYNRAGRIMDQMEVLGIVGEAKGSKPREVLFYSMEELNAFLLNLKSRI